MPRRGSVLSWLHLGGIRTARVDSAVLLLGNVLPMLTGVATAPLTARALGPHGRSVVAVSIAIGGVLVVVDSVGLPWRTRLDVVRDPRSAHHLNRVGITVSLISLVPAAGIGVAVCAAYDVSGWSRVLVVWYFAILALAAWMSVRAWITLSTRRHAVYGGINLCGTVVVVAVIFGLLATHRLTVGTALAANSLNPIIQLVGNWFASASVVRQARRDPRRAPSRWMSNWAGQISDICATRSDVLIAAALYPAVAVGRYSVPSLLVLICYQVSQTVLQRDLHVLASGSRGAATYLWSLRRLLIANSVVALVGAAAAVTLIPPLLGAQFHRSIDYVPAVVCLSVGLAALAAGLFELSRRDAGAAVLLGHGVLPALATWALSAVVSIPLTVMPAVLGAMYLLGVPVILATTRRRPFSPFLPTHVAV